MQDIINPIDRALLKAELTKEKRLRSTNKSKNEIYIVTAHDSPNVMQEIGRLREVAFRYYGGGTGFPVDIDEYDTMEDAYRQLIVWSPEDEQILGGYRFREIYQGDPSLYGRVGTLVRGSGVSIHPFRGERLIRVG